MKILVATDGSEDAANALDFTLRFPFPPDSTISVMTVASNIPMLQEEVDALDETLSGQLDQANQALLADAEALVQRDSVRLQADGWSGEALVRNGYTVDQILAVAEEKDIDLIVLGSHGKGAAQRFLLGSVSDRVLEYAHCSVMIVKQSEADAADIEPGSNAPMKLMLGYDQSDVSSEALDICAALPLEPGSEIDVVSVMPLVTAYRQDIRQHINGIWQQKRNLMQQQLDQSVAARKWAIPSVKTHLREAESVSDEILQAAEQAGSDLIAIGCKNRSTIKNLLLGSVTRQIAHHATCTVWAVRKKPKQA